jgi:flagellar biosynthesis GTPase FlhF
MENYVRALNGLLPPDVRIMKAEPVPEDFSSRFNATSRVYHYFLYTGDVPPADRSRFVWHLPKRPNIDVLNRMCSVLHGEIDCATFAAAGDQSKSTFRYIDGVPVLTAWCGRSIMGLVSMRRALKDFNDELKEMTDDITVSEEKAPKPENTEKKDKQSRKEAKAAIKEAKKAEKEAKKVQKAQEKAAAALAAAEAAKAEAEARAAAAAAEAARLAAEAQQIAQEAEIPEPEVPEAETSAPEEQNE